jgi:hypothetical protein
MPERRFPPPWTVEQQTACFVVRDYSGQKLAHVYFEDERDGDRRRNCSPKTAGRIAANIAKPPVPMDQQKQSPKHVARGLLECLL